MRKRNAGVSARGCVGDLSMCTSESELKVQVCADGAAEGATTDSGLRH